MKLFRSKYILLSILVITACSFSVKDRKEVQTVKPNNEKVIVSNSISGYQLVYSMKSKDGEQLGNVSVKKVEQDTSFFSSLIITKDNNSVLYRIDNTKFTNSNGVDIEVSKDGFYGYKFIVKRDDYFVIYLYSNQGKNISDPITIEWNYKSNMFAVEKSR